MFVAVWFREKTNQIFKEHLPIKCKDLPTIKIGLGSHLLDKILRSTETFEVFSTWFNPLENSRSPRGKGTLRNDFSKTKTTRTATAVLSWVSFYLTQPSSWNIRNMTGVFSEKNSTISGAAGCLCFGVLGGLRLCHVVVDAHLRGPGMASMGWSLQLWIPRLELYFGACNNPDPSSSW